MTSWLRLAFALCAAVLVWTVGVAPAQAAAPRCDTRGAITFGPPPKLEEPVRSLDVAPSAPCLEALLSSSSIERGHRPWGEGFDPSYVALSPRTATVPAFEGEALEPLDEAPLRLHEHRAALERPPR